MTGKGETCEAPDTAWEARAEVPLMSAKHLVTALPSLSNDFFIGPVHYRTIGGLSIPPVGDEGGAGHDPVRLATWQC